MARRGIDTVSSQLMSSPIDKEHDIQVLESQEFTLEEKLKELIPEVLVTLMKDVHLNHVGKVSGRAYHFPGAGSVVSVDYRDIEYMKSYGNRNSCCGSNNSPYFQFEGGEK